MFALSDFQDFILVRGSDDVIRVYIVEGAGFATKVYEENDPEDKAVSVLVNGKYQFMLFMDDTDTNDEWSDGGTVESIRVWDGEYQPPDFFYVDGKSGNDTTDCTNSAAPCRSIS